MITVRGAKSLPRRGRVRASRPPSGDGGGASVAQEVHGGCTDGVPAGPPAVAPDALAHAASVTATSPTALPTNNVRTASSPSVTNSDAMEGLFGCTYHPLRPRSAAPNPGDLGRPWAGFRAGRPLGSRAEATSARCAGPRVPGPPRLPRPVRPRG